MTDRRQQGAALHGRLGPQEGRQVARPRGAGGPPAPGRREHRAAVPRQRQRQRRRPSAHFGDRLAAAVAARESQIVLGIDPDPARLWPAAVEARARRARASRRRSRRPRTRRRRRDSAAPGRGRRRAPGGRRRGARALPRADRRRRPRLRRRQAAARLLRAPRRARLARARARLRARPRRRPARARRRQARRRPGHRRRLRAGARRRARRRRSAPSPACDADAFTANPLLGRDALEPLIDAARAAGAGVVRARAHLQPGRRRRARPRARDRRAAVGAPRARSSTSSARRASRPRRRRRRHRRDRARAPRAPARADAAPRRSCCPGIGAQGGDVAALAPAFAPGRAGGLVTASRSIANAHEKPAATPADGRPRRGRAPARAGLGPGLSRLTAAIIARDGRSQPRALPGAASRWWPSSSRSTPSSRTRATDGRRAPAATAATHRATTATTTPTKKSRKKRKAQDLHGQARRHAVRHRREDRRLARDAPGAQPEPRPADASRPGQKIKLQPVSARRVLAAAARRRARCSPPRRRAAAPRARLPGSVGAPSAIVDRGLDRRRRLRPRSADRRRPIGSTTKLMTALLDARARRSSSTRSRPSRYRAGAGRVADRPAARRADDGRATCMRGLLIESGNDAAVTLAAGRRPAPSAAFVRLMNRRARAARAEEHALREPDRARRRRATTRPRATS